MNQIEVVIPDAQERIEKIVNAERALHHGMGLAQFRICFPKDDAFFACGINENTKHLLSVYHENPKKFYTQLLEVAPTIARLDGKFKHRKRRTIKDHYLSYYYRVKGQDYFDIVHLSGVLVVKGKGTPEDHINANAEAIFHGLVHGMFKLLLLNSDNPSLIKLIRQCIMSPTHRR